MTAVWLGASCRAGGVVADGGASISAGALSANPSALSFGDVPLGRTASQNVRLTNTGAGTVTITQLDVTGSGFTGSGLAVPVTLAPGESRSVAVAFAPTTVGNLTGKVSVATDPPHAPRSPVVIALTGNGLQTGPQFYVATTRSDSNPGSATQPWRTIQKAIVSNYSEALTADGPSQSNFVVENNWIHDTDALAIDLHGGAHNYTIRGNRLEYISKRRDGTIWYGNPSVPIYNDGGNTGIPARAISRCRRARPRSTPAIRSACSTSSGPSISAASRAS
jgi:hypothetical protein